MTVDVIEACFITSESWCEYCANIPSKVYLPFHSKVLNPAYICEECFKLGDYNLVGWYDKYSEYRHDLYDLKEDDECK